MDKLWIAVFYLRLFMVHNMVRSKPLDLIFV